MYYSNRDAVGNKVGGCNRQGGRLSGVTIKRGSTVHIFTCMYVHVCMCLITNYPLNFSSIIVSNNM